MGLTAFLVVYLFGGLTFLPLLIAAIIYVYTKPVPPGDGADGLTRPGDDLAALENARREHGHEHDYDQGHRGGTEKKSRFDQHHHHVDDFATAGYFAVFREYVAIGVNSKPVEPSTVGPNTVAPPSPSVYQTFFRNMLTKKGSSSGGGAGAGGGVSGGKRVVGAAQGQGAVASAAALAAGAGAKGSGPVMVEVSSAASPRPKNARNMFYVVLRHGHLILFDDDQQVDVRHVIKLADHDVTVYAGAGKRVVPEGELFIKRNALQLKPRHPERAVRAHNAPVPQPWYLYSDNCAEKEDFYFALLRSQSQEAAGTRGGLGEPRARAIEVRHLTSLMERLHASEEAAEMRWLNALVGRMFLGVYQTPELAAFVKNKFVTKLSRAPRPGFVASLEVQRVDLGTTTPQITSPRLRSLTAEGECVVEADVRFTGHFGMDVAATLRVNTPIGTQEVRTSLAVAFTRLEGPVLFKIKAPPSNRLWFTFRHMPKVEMEIRPIIAARQLTWPLVIQMIEGKIKETIAESLVLPFWEDMPFFGTERKRWRGGVWEDDSGVPGEEGGEEVEGGEGVERGDMVEGGERMEGGPEDSIETDGVDAEVAAATTAAAAAAATLTTGSENVSPAVLRLRRLSQNYSAPAMVSSTSSSSDGKGPSPKKSKQQQQAVSESGSTSRKWLSRSSRQRRAEERQEGESSGESAGGEDESCRETGEETKEEAEAGGGEVLAPVSEDDDDEGETAMQTLATNTSSTTMTSGQSSTTSLTRETRETREARETRETRELSSNNKRSAALAAAMTGAAATAKRWGINALQRRAAAAAAAAADRKARQGLGERRMSSSGEALDLSKPMGGGRPLPPPGEPLPMPGELSRGGGVKGVTGRRSSVVARKPVPQPQPRRTASSEQMRAQQEERLQLERQRQWEAQVALTGMRQEGDVMVLQAPVDSDEEEGVEEEVDEMEESRVENSDESRVDLVDEPAIPEDSEEDDGLAAWDVDYETGGETGETGETGGEMGGEMEGETETERETKSGEMSGEQTARTEGTETARDERT